MRGEAVLVESLAIVAANHEHGVVPLAVALEVLKQTRDLRVLVIETVRIAPFDDVDLLDRKFRPHDREVDLPGAEATRKIFGHHVRQMAALTIHVTKERLV